MLTSETLLGVAEAATEDCAAMAVGPMTRQPGPSDLPAMAAIRRGAITVGSGAPDGRTDRHPPHDTQVARVRPGPGRTATG